MNFFPYMSRLIEEGVLGILLLLLLISIFAIRYLVLSQREELRRKDMELGSRLDARTQAFIDMAKAQTEEAAAMKEIVRTNTEAIQRATETMMRVDHTIQTCEREQTERRLRNATRG